MKVLENKTTELTGENGPLKYADLIGMVFNQLVPGGVPPDQLRKDFRVMDVVEKGGEEFHFEDEDAKTLQAMVKNFGWTLRRRGFLDFSDDVAAMSAPPE